MNTTRLLTLAGGTALVLCTAPATAGNSPDSPPNVVIIMTDDQGYADTGKFGATGDRKSVV